MTRGAVIGVLGGMGPEATHVFYGHLIAATPAARDQDHVRVFIDSNPGIPDRTEAVLNLGPSPVPMMLDSIEGLHRAGASFVVIPCVSAHVFIDELRAKSALPILSILDCVAEAVVAGGHRRVGLLATDGTLRAGVFARRLRADGIETLTPSEDDQTAVSAAIRAVKGGADPSTRSRHARALDGVASRLRDRGATGLVLGCTEIPLIYPRPTEADTYDSLRLLALAALRAAGREPVPAEPVPVTAEAVGGRS